MGLGPQLPRAGNGTRAAALARNAHIFANAVREVLETHFLAKAAGFPLTVSQLHLLKLIQLEGRHVVGEVAEFLGVSAAAASKNVEKLVRLGLVSRSTPAQDRRLGSLELTGAGRRVVEHYDARERAILDRVIDDMGPSDAERLVRLLERFYLTLLAGSANGPSCLRCGAHFDAGCPIHVLKGFCPYVRARRAARTAPKGAQQEQPAAADERRDA